MANEFVDSRMRSLIAKFYNMFSRVRKLEINKADANHAHNNEKADLY